MIQEIEIILRSIQKWYNKLYIQYIWWKILYKINDKKRIEKRYSFSGTIEFVEVKKQRKRWNGVRNKKEMDSRKKPSSHDAIVSNCSRYWNNKTITKWE